MLFNKCSPLSQYHSGTIDRPFLAVVLLLFLLDRETSARCGNLGFFSLHHYGLSEIYHRYQSPLHHRKEVKRYKVMKSVTSRALDKHELAIDNRAVPGLAHSIRGGYVPTQTDGGSGQKQRVTEREKKSTTQKERL